MKSKSEFRIELANCLGRRLTLDHPILNELTRAEKNLPLIRKMALQGYQLTKNFTGYLGFIYTHCKLEDFRRRIITNLYEEETGKLSNTANHMELIHRFVFALGITREELEAEQALPKTQELIDYRWTLCRNPELVHMGAAAVMIASEGQNLETKAGKSRDQMVPAMYGLTAYDLEFFSVHAIEDVGHVDDGLDFVSEICTTDAMQAQALEAITGTCDRFWGFYDGIQKAYEAETGRYISAAVETVAV